MVPKIEISTPLRSPAALPDATPIQVLVQTSLRFACIGDLNVDSNQAGLGGGAVPIETDSDLASLRGGNPLQLRQMFSQYLREVFRMCGVITLGPQRNQRKFLVLPGIR